MYFTLICTLRETQLNRVGVFEIVPCDDVYVSHVYQALYLYSINERKQTRHSDASYGDDMCSHLSRYKDNLSPQGKSEIWFHSGLDPVLVRTIVCVRTNEKNCVYAYHRNGKAFLESATKFKPAPEYMMAEWGEKLEPRRFSFGIYEIYGETSSLLWHRKKLVQGYRA